MGIFKRKAEPPLTLEETVAPAARINHLVDDMVSQVLGRFKDLLLSQPAAYVVPAVWGAAKDIELDETQAEIHQMVLPMVAQVLEIIRAGDLQADQKYAFDFLLRGLLINRLTYALELARGMAQENALSTLNGLETMGSA